MKKKVVAIIPIKKNSKRVKGKNFIKIKGKPLYRYLLDKLKKTHFDEIYIDTDSSEIRNCFDIGCRTYVSSVSNLLS